MRLLGIPHIERLVGLLSGVFLFFLGQGAVLLVVPLQLAANHASHALISLAGSSYFIGVLLGAYFHDRVIRSAGATKAYALFAALVSCAALSLLLLSDPIAWPASRFVHGWAAAGVFLSVESWLQIAASNKARGRLFALYTTLSLTALGLGQLLVNLYGASADQTIILSAVLIALSIAPVAYSPMGAQDTLRASRAPSWRVVKHAPIGAISSVAAGLGTGAFWAIGPLFATASDMSPPTVAAFTANITFGAVLFVVVFGRISDAFDRARVLAAVAAAGSVASIAIIAAFSSGPALVVCAIIQGGVIFALHPLSVAYAASHPFPGEDWLDVTRGQLLLNYVGSGLGPLLAGGVMAVEGRLGYFEFSAVMLACLTLGILFLNAHRKRATLKTPDRTQ
ncbi:MAG: MFS transporter [Hyphomonadaceae bacterium]|nr:MFS transporter [Hyphomonadaceae bacterium]